MKLRWNWIHIFHTIHQSDKFFSFYILSFLLHWSLFWMRSIYELNVCLKIKFWISSKNCPRILKKTTSVCENQGKISDKKYAFILNDISTQMWKPINHLKNVRLKICPKQTLQLNPLSIWYWNKFSLTIVISYGTQLLHAGADVKYFMVI